MGKGTAPQTTDSWSAHAAPAPDPSGPDLDPPPGPTPANPPQAASDVTPCGLEDDLLNAIAAAAGTLGRASQQRLRAELRDAAAAAAPAVADVGSRSPRRFW